MLEWGPHMKTLLRSHRQTGILPPALRNKPEPGIVSGFLVEAFFVLHASRGIAFNGSQPLNMADILVAAEFFGYTSSDEKYAFLKALQELDRVYLSEESDRIKRNKETMTK